MSYQLESGFHLQQPPAGRNIIDSELRRPSLWSSTRMVQSLDTMVSKGRRASAVKMINTFLYGPLPPRSPNIQLNSDSEDENTFHYPITEESTKNNEKSASNHIIADPKITRHQANVNIGLILSALYGKLLVVMGIAFPMSEVISTYIPPAYYDGFYIYLYVMGIIFMTFLLGNTVKIRAARSRHVKSLTSRFNSYRQKAPSTCTSEDAVDQNEQTTMNREVVGTPESLNSFSATIAGGESKGQHHFGSFYLRIGALAFGIGSMIYSGLEFGQYFELEHEGRCDNILVAVTPFVRIIFTFTQMYFIFLHSKETAANGSMAAQFGLMHMIGTNLCVWLNVLVLETRHEILHFYDPNNRTITLKYFSKGQVPEFVTGYHKGHHDYPEPSYLMSNISEAASSLGSTIGASLLNLNGDSVDADIDFHHRMKRGLRGPHSMYECRRTNIMGNLVSDAAPFLYPCTIEYSLICAAICYAMWKEMASRRVTKRNQVVWKSTELVSTRSPHHYTVDCARANKGLFLGIFVLVLVIICIILNFVLDRRQGYESMASLQVAILKIVLTTTATLAVLIGMCQVRSLRYDNKRNLELDNILLIVAQTGSFIYSFFTIIAGQFAVSYNHKLTLVSGLSSLIQTLLQTLFILDASKRSAGTPCQARIKPGREIVTFLLVTNLGMWLVNTLGGTRDIVQTHFYGVWAWTIISDISMPLSIFYRFHSTVCLCEIWKKIGKLRS